MIEEQLSAAFILTIAMMSQHPKLAGTMLARKMLHVGSSLCLDFIFPYPYKRSTQVLTALVSIIIVAQTIFLSSLSKTGKKGVDAGIMIFGVVVCAAMLMQIPPWRLRPLLYGDPAAAIIGSAFQHYFPQSWLSAPPHGRAKTNSKSLAGSLGMWAVCFVCGLVSPLNLSGVYLLWGHSAVTAALFSMIESQSGVYDNAALGVGVFICYLVPDVPWSELLALTFATVLTTKLSKWL